MILNHLTLSKCFMCVCESFYVCVCVCVFLCVCLLWFHNIRLGVRSIVCVCELMFAGKDDIKMDEQCVLRRGYTNLRTRCGLRVGQSSHRMCAMRVATPDTETECTRRRLRNKPASICIIAMFEGFSTCGVFI